MLRDNSPLEHLAAFAIVFAAGVISTFGLGWYVDRIKRHSIERHDDKTTN
ncbi:hypothetical protein [Herbaspirillum lusitanum]|nr:hypothetical protein [Herbaspirillum lusitanum]